MEVNFTICKSQTKSQFVIHNLWVFNSENDEP